MAQQVTEHEITPIRSEEEKQALGKHPHALDFQFSPEDLVHPQPQLIHATPQHVFFKYYIIKIFIIFIIFTCGCCSRQAFLDENGYVVVKGLFSEETCEQMKKEVFERAHTLMGVEKDNHTTWDVYTPRASFPTLLGLN